MRFFLLFTLCGLLFKLGAQDTNKISEDLYVTRISENLYIHTSYYTLEEWGRFGSNGMLYVSNDSAVLFDTPMSDEVSLQLLNWIDSVPGARVVAFVPNHWHNDCTGGIHLLSGDVKIYASERTAQILRDSNMAVPHESFKDSIELNIGGRQIVCAYHGAGHTIDNIVVWIPSEAVLFGGCMVRALQSNSLGNTTDADLTEWPVTIQKVIGKYPGVELVIPGHGSWGDGALLEHTLYLLKEGP